MTPRANDKRRAAMFVHRSLVRARMREVADGASRGAFELAMRAQNPWAAALGAIAGGVHTYAKTHKTWRKIR